MALNFKQLEAFVAVADLGTFRRAAEKLHTTQPNISARIANLEARLNVSLMTRDAGSVRLTPKGQTLLEHARAVIAAGDAMLVAAGDDSLFEGVLRLGVTELIAVTWLRGFMVALKQRFPNVAVELTVDLSAPLSAALDRHELDLALQSGPFPTPSSGHIDLTTHPWVWVSHPHLGLPEGKVTVEDLAHHQILTHTRGTDPFRQLHAHFSKVPGAKVRLVPSSNITACLQMTLDGLGLSCLPTPMVQPHINEGRLQAVGYGWTPDPLSFAARFEAETCPAYIAEAAEMARDMAT